jgi:hypothetical protein
MPVERKPASEPTLESTDESSTPLSNPPEAAKRIPAVHTPDKDNVVLGFCWRSHEGEDGLVGSERHQCHPRGPDSHEAARKMAHRTHEDEIRDTRRMQQRGWYRIQRGSQRISAGRDDDRWFAQSAESTNERSNIRQLSAVEVLEVEDAGPSTQYSFLNLIEQVQGADPTWASLNVGRIADEVETADSPVTDRSLEGFELTGMVGSLGSLPQHDHAGRFSGVASRLAGAIHIIHIGRTPGDDRPSAR